MSKNTQVAKSKALLPTKTLFFLKYDRIISFSEYYAKYKTAILYIFLKHNPKITSFDTSLNKMLKKSCYPFIYSN